MDWKKLLGSITASVDEELRLRNAYLHAENRMLRQQITGRLQLLDGDRKALAELGQPLGKKALTEIATIAQPDTILAWHRRLADQKMPAHICWPSAHRQGDRRRGGAHGPRELLVGLGPDCGRLGQPGLYSQ